MTRGRPDTFTGKAAVIERGGCEFGVKVLNAEQAGAAFAIVYNTPAGGEELINMGPGAVGQDVTITSIFVGNTAGQGIVDAYTADPAAVAVIDTFAFQLGNTPDQVSNFSSRGPGVGLALLPDIAAPGVNILAQGYTPGATGEAQYLGYGQASGTSMAAPHVAGAAILLRQAYPQWSNAAIKSALMSTAKYTDVYNFDGAPAQPLDMGAGRLDLTHALDPGVLLDPPSVSFGAVPTGTLQTLAVTRDQRGHADGDLQREHALHGRRLHGDDGAAGLHRDADGLCAGLWPEPGRLGDRGRRPRARALPRTRATSCLTARRTMRTCPYGRVSSPRRRWRTC